MSYGIAGFMILVGVIVFGYTIRGFVRRDFSASGVKISRHESPAGFWLTGAWLLVACAVIGFFLFEAVRNAFF